MLGPEHGRAKVESQPDFTRDFEELVTRYCFGSVWGREGISRGTRSMLTIAMLVALGLLAKDVGIAAGRGGGRGRPGLG